MTRHWLRGAALALALVGTAAAAAPSYTATITRDEWGIPHIHGNTDADAVYGMMYAQAEDDFPRIETNYLTNIGRLAKARYGATSVSGSSSILSGSAPTTPGRRHGSAR